MGNCQKYAGLVLQFYKKCNNGAVPASFSEAKCAVQEYNREWRSFKALFGYSIRGSVDEIATYMLIVAANA